MTLNNREDNGKLEIPYNNKHTDHLASPLVDKSGRYYKMAEIWTSKFGAYFMLNENTGE